MTNHYFEFANRNGYEIKRYLQFAICIINADINSLFLASICCEVAGGDEIFRDKNEIFVFLICQFATLIFLWLFSTMRSKPSEVRPILCSFQVLIHVSAPKFCLFTSSLTQCFILWKLIPFPCLSIGDEISKESLYQLDKIFTDPFSRPSASFIL